MSPCWHSILFGAVFFLLSWFLFIFLVPSLIQLLFNASRFFVVRSSACYSIYSSIYSSFASKYNVFPRRLSYLYHASILNSRFRSSIFSIFNISNTGSSFFKRIYSSLALTFPRQHSVFYNDLNIMKVVIMILSEFPKFQTGKGSYFKIFLGIWKYLNKMLCICKEVALC